MTNYEIFDLLHSDLRHKFEADNRVFMQKYTVGWQQIRIHCLKDEKLDIIECLDSLNKLQEKYSYCSSWTRFHFSCFWTHHSIVVYQFLSGNEDKVRLYENFCGLTIS